MENLVLSEGLRIELSPVPSRRARSFLRLIELTLHVSALSLIYNSMLMQKGNLKLRSAYPTSACRLGDLQLTKYAHVYPADPLSRYCLGKWRTFGDLECTSNSR